MLASRRLPLNVSARTGNGMAIAALSWRGSPIGRVGEGIDGFSVED